MTLETQPQRSIYAIATMDTKGEEINYVADCIRRFGQPVKTVDVGTATPALTTPDMTRQQVLACLENQSGNISDQDRGVAVGVMGKALSKFLQAEAAAGRVAGVLGIGGSGGTALITAAMRALDVGLPKLMVSTVASGNTAPYVDSTDIAMMYSVVDIAGLNRVSRRVLANAAHAIAGMAQGEFERVRTASENSAASTKPTIGMTMFGVTTPCINTVRSLLEPRGFECLVFHATGTGGRTMERLVESGLIEGVMDLTTTEVADEIAGGVFACGSERFERLLAKKVPLVLSLGALDMVNFGSMDTVPEKYKNRKLHVHNANVTLMRTTAEENVLIAKWIAAKLRQATVPWTLLLPRAGLSALDSANAPFYDPDADEALFDTLINELESVRLGKIVDLPHHINDSAFAEMAVNAYLQLT